MLVVLVGLLGIVTTTNFRTNSIVENFAGDDFKNRQVVRVAMQIRHQLMRSLWGCYQSAHFANEKQKNEAQENCIGALEAALSQFSEELVIDDVPRLNERMSELYDLATQIIDEKNIGKAENEERLEQFKTKVNSLFIELGEAESALWANGSDRYGRLVKEFSMANKMSLISIFMVFFIVGYFLVLTLLKERADRRLAEAQEKLEEQRSILIHSSKMSALGEMASGIAHEINNPLAIIHSKTEKVMRMSAEGRLTNEVTQDSLRKALDMVMRINKIIRGLRNFARDGEGDSFIPTSLQQIIADTVELCSSRLQNHKIDLRLVPLGADVMIQCRGSQISQVILNLIHNAHDAIEHMQGDLWIELKAIDEEDQVRIVVTDCGKGIPKAIQDKMFQPFFTTKEVGKGTGLGLSISSGIIKAHYGQIGVDTKSENTSIFFTIPKKHIEKTVKRVG